MHHPPEVSVQARHRLQRETASELSLSHRRVKAGALKGGGTHVFIRKIKYCGPNSNNVMLSCKTNGCSLSLYSDPKPVTMLTSLHLYLTLFNLYFLKPYFKLNESILQVICLPSST